MSYSNDNVLEIMLNYAENDDNIRAVLMEGSRAFGEVDEYSDYDLVYVTESSQPYFDGAILPFLKAHFGEITVMQTPDNGDPHDVYTHLIQFSSGIRIDLTFNSISFLIRTPLESATVILLDKDGRFAGIAPPSDQDFWVKRPSTDEFKNQCNEFWWCAPYIAKAVARGQLLHGIELLSLVRKEYYTMLTYLVGLRNNWQVSPGKHCTDAKLFLPQIELTFYEALIKSYVPANEKEILFALNKLMVYYDKLALIIAKELGYEYNSLEAARTIRFIQDRF